MRKIIHVDMDAFYASVEQRDDPSLKGRPVVVGGSPDDRGVVASCSYEARKFGIRSAMSSAKAYRLCPQAVFLRTDFQKYRRASQTIQAIFHSITDLVEPLSLDEAYLDVTVNHLGEPLARKLAVLIRKRILEETGLTASAGVGPNKFIAKVASDLRKPDGLVVVPPEKVAKFVEKLPIERFWGVGPATAKVLHAAGIFDASDLRARKRSELEQIVGRYGAFLHDLAHGRDDRAVDPNQDTKSCGTETTFSRDVRDARELAETVREQARELAAELKKIKRPARTITLKLRYSDFKTITRSRTLHRYTDEATRIAKTAVELLRESTEAGRRPVRLVGVSLTNLYDENLPEQLWFDFPVD
ncbi:MAG: DNA polymerase IV [Bdellovibrionota bacterium]